MSSGSAGAGRDVALPAAPHGATADDRRSRSAASASAAASTGVHGNVVTTAYDSASGGPASHDVRWPVPYGNHGTCVRNTGP